MGDQERGGNSFAVFELTRMSTVCLLGDLSKSQSKLQALLTTRYRNIYCFDYSEAMSWTSFNSSWALCFRTSGLRASCLTSFTSSLSKAQTHIFSAQGPHVC